MFFLSVGFFRILVDEPADLFLLYVNEQHISTHIVASILSHWNRFLSRSSRKHSDNLSQTAPVKLEATWAELVCSLSGCCYKDDIHIGHSGLQQLGIKVPLWQNDRDFPCLFFERMKHHVIVCLIQRWKEVDSVKYVVFPKIKRLRLLLIYSFQRSRVWTNFWSTIQREVQQNVRLMLLLSKPMEPNLFQKSEIVVGQSSCYRICTRKQTDSQAGISRHKLLCHEQQTLVGAGACLY